MVVLPTEVGPASSKCRRSVVILSMPSVDVRVRLLTKHLIFVARSERTWGVWVAFEAICPSTATA